MRIPTLLQKIGDLTAQPERRTAIDVDLMMDYTRVLYADLLEWRARLPATTTPSQIVDPPAEAMGKSRPNEQTEIPRVSQTETPAMLPNTDIPKAPEAANLQSPISNQPDIRAHIGINDKYQIMSELFGNDKAAYEQSLDFINQSKNESEAMHWLREQLWITEEHSDAAQSFFEIVGRFFKS